ncbi:MAG: hypothetical protein KAR40_08380 [Candidatus Sabulitectum sp.]|nr:hypothetical protein [Candidatus Sabulitectum sp.]
MTYWQTAYISCCEIAVCCVDCLFFFGSAFGEDVVREESIVNGDITRTVSELKNDLYLSGVNGEITVDLTTDVIVKIETVNGDIEIYD